MPLRIWPRISVRILQITRTSLDIVFCRLQTIQEGEESVARFESSRLSTGRGGFRKCSLFHGKRRFEINLRSFNAFVTEPQCDHRAVDA